MGKSAKQAFWQHGAQRWLGVSRGGVWLRYRLTRKAYSPELTQGLRVQGLEPVKAVTYVGHSSALTPDRNSDVEPSELHPITWSELLKDEHVSKNVVPLPKWGDEMTLKKAA